MKNSIFTHRALATFLATLALVIVLCSFGDNNTQRFKDAVMNLGNTSHTLTNEFDYWPECGIRVTGSHLDSLISLSDLELMLPCPLYNSGPHHRLSTDTETVKWPDGHKLSPLCERAIPLSQRRRRLLSHQFLRHFSLGVEEVYAFGVILVSIAL